MRVTPALLAVNDPIKLPLIYHRQANKSKHYISGSFGKVESVFNMQDWRQHAHFRKFIAGPVSDPPLQGLSLILSVPYFISFGIESERKRASNGFNLIMLSVLIYGVNSIALPTSRRWSHWWI